MNQIIKRLFGSSFKDGRRWIAMIHVALFVFFWISIIYSGKLPLSSIKISNIIPLFYAFFGFFISQWLLYTLILCICLILSLYSCTSIITLDGMVLKNTSASPNSFSQYFQSLYTSSAYTQALINNCHCTSMY